MDDTQPRVLVAGVDRGPFEGLAPVLERQNLNIERVDSPSEAIDLACREAFNLVIFDTDPIAGAFESSVERLRDGSSASRNAPLLILTSRDAAGSVRELVGRGVSRVMLLDDPMALVGQEVADLLEISPRSAVRLTVRLWSTLSDGQQVAAGTTENLSSTGALMRTETPIAPGTRVTIEIHTTDREDPVRGHAVVVRHADNRREGLEGLAVRFFDFEGDGQQRIDGIVSYLAV